MGNKIDGSIIVEPNPELVLYAVRNRKGQYFHALGYGGYGRSWVDTLQEARIYGKIGPAKRQVTYWGSHYPDYGTPELLKITMASIEVIDQSARVDKFKIKKAKEEAENKKRWAKQKIQNAKEDIARAERDMKAAQKEIEAIGEKFRNPVLSH